MKGVACVEKTQRNEAIYDCRERAMPLTYQQIADAFGITKERGRQIYMKMKAKRGSRA